MFRQTFAIFCLTFIASFHAHAVVKEAVSKAWMRLDGDVANLKMNSHGDQLAFTNSNGQELRVLDTRSKDVRVVSKLSIGPAFFWAPDGKRLFYRELHKDKNKLVHSDLKVFDTSKMTNVAVESFPHITGLLSFDPRDLRMHFLSEKGLHSKRLIFPDERLARWQVAQRSDRGKWVAAQNGIMWATDGGFTLARMQDDGSPVQSFDISPDGSSIAWSTTAGKVYTSNNGKDVKTIGFGHDPKWHPFKPILLYSAARMVGNKASNYDLRIVDEHGATKYLTSSQGIDERWPTWNPDGNLVYFTKDKSTDLFTLEFSSL